MKQLSFYQTGRNKPGADTLEKLARAGRVTVDSLLGLQPAPLVREIPEPYGALERADKKTLDEVEELLRDADDDVKRHLRNQIKLLRRVQRSPKKRASGKD